MLQDMDEHTLLSFVTDDKLVFKRSSSVKENVKHQTNGQARNYARWANEQKSSSTFFHHWYYRNTSYWRTFSFFFSGEASSRERASLPRESRSPLFVKPFLSEIFEHLRRPSETASVASGGIIHEISSFARPTNLSITRDRRKSSLINRGARR